MAAKNSLNLLEKTLTEAKQTLAGMEELLYNLGLHEQKIIELYIESKNKDHFKDFSSTPYSKRVILLPQCLRAAGCRAKLEMMGYKCEGCGECPISGIITEATQLGYQVFILAGGTMAEKIFEKYRPDACLGVACLKELVLGISVSERKGIAALVVPLLRDGCVRTAVNLDEVLTMMHLTTK